MVTPTSRGSAPSLGDLEDHIRTRIQKDRYTHKEVSDCLHRKYPGVRGFSVRSIERFCRDREIHKTTKISVAALDRVVTNAVEKVGSVRKLLVKLLVNHFSFI